MSEQIYNMDSGYRNAMRKITNKVKMIDEHQQYYLYKTSKTLYNIYN